MRKPLAARSLARLLLVAIVSVPACGGDGARSHSSGPGPASASAAASALAGVSTTPDPGSRWLSVIRAAPKADDLDELMQRLRDDLGRALVVSPADCLDGLPADLNDGYVIGAVGSSGEETERLVTEAGETAVFTGPVTIVCTD